MLTHLMLTHCLLLSLLLQCADGNVTPHQLAQNSLNSGDLSAALMHARQAVTASPNSTQSIEILATALTWTSQYDQAESILLQALSMATDVPSHLHFHRNLGNLINYYYPHPHSTKTKARILHHYQSYIQSIESHAIATTVFNTMGIYNDMALLYQTEGQITKAAHHFQRALDLDTNTTDYKILTNYGLLLSKLDTTQLIKSIAMQRRAVTVCRGLHATNDPAAQHDLPRLLLNLGSVLINSLTRDSNKDEAMALWEEALQLDPLLTLAADALGNQHAGAGNIAKAQFYYQKGIASAKAQNDGHLEISLLIKLQTLLPRVYDSTDDVVRWNWKFTSNLKTLLSAPKVDTNDPRGQRLMISPDDPARAVLSMGYYLVYQGLNNRLPREMMANVYRRYLPSLENNGAPTSVPTSAPTSAPTSKVERAPLRVGFFSEYLYEHSSTKLIFQVILQLATRKNNNIEVYIIVPSSMKRDSMTLALFDAVGGVEHGRVVFVPGITSLPTTRQLIQDLHLDVLVFAEIGMGMCSYFLGFAARTLARRSIQFWGHGVTSGIQKGVDYFVTSKLFHHAYSDREAQALNAMTTVVNAEFTERLYFHDSLTVAFDQPPIVLPEERMNLRQLIGVDGGQPHYYLAPTSLYKFHPLMDHSMAQILLRDPLAILVLVGGASSIWSDQIVERIRRVLPDEQENGTQGNNALNARKRIVVVPPMPRKKYLSFMASGHVVMLPFPITSGVTVFETISVGTPFVSYSGSANYLLQHYAPGILKAMDVDRSCCIAVDEQDYVDKILKFGTDPEWRKKISQQFTKGSKLLFGDRFHNGVVEEWERMLRNVLTMKR